MEFNVLRAVTPCSLQSCYQLFNVSYETAFICWIKEDRGSSFSRKVSEFLPAYTAPHSSAQESLQSKSWSDIWRNNLLTIAFKRKKANGRETRFLVCSSFSLGYVAVAVVLAVQQYYFIRSSWKQTISSSLPVLYLSITQGSNLLHYVSAYDVLTLRIPFFENTKLR